MKGQIVKIISNNFTVNSRNKRYECKCRGKFRNDKITPLVGDYVIFDQDKQLIIQILPRKNELIRPMVANIDQGIIVTSVKKPNLSLDLLDKLIVIMEYNKITPIICFTKLDLLTKKEKEQLKKISQYYQKIGYITLKNTKLRHLKKVIKDKVSVLTGQTGVGKSTLLNKLDNRLNLKTAEISLSLGRGKHTTRHVELIEIHKGKVLDTPGFSALDFNHLLNEEIKAGFKEFNNFECPYQDCLHINEKECLIKKEVQLGNILPSRYQTYKNLILKKGN
jgi:ribosome biogenesis GTPase